MQDHWLVRPSTIRLLWILSLAVLAAVVLADLAVTPGGHFGIDSSLGFGAWYGFAACVALVAFAKLLGVFLKRPDTTYGD